MWILKVIKLLYNVSEAVTHGFATYHNHDIKKLGMEHFIYKFILLDNPGSWDIVNLQRNEILILARSLFASKKEERIWEVRLMSKNWEYLSVKRLMKLNNKIIEMTTEEILIFKHECQIAAIAIVKRTRNVTTSITKIIKTSLTPKEQYVAQRVQRTYVTLICQTEAIYNLSHTTPITNSTFHDMKTLNQRLL